MNKQNPIKKIFDLYTSDLSFNEIERLIKKESAEVYHYFISDIPKDNKSKNKLTRTLLFVRSLFNAFILKLAPARRIFYLAAIIIFFIGYIQDLGSYLILSFVILNLLLAFELADKLIFKNDIILARKIQSDLMPKTHPNIDGLQIASYYESANEVGGDYYDFIDSRECKLLVVGDISGKGLPAALYMVRVQAIMRLLASSHDSPKEIILNVQKQFSQNLRKGYFLTMIAAKICDNKRLQICRAGHTPVLHFKKSEDKFEEINPVGIGIGLNKNGIFENTLEEKEVTANSGDIFLFYSDGITEAMNNKKEQFGIAEIKRVISENSDRSAEYLKERIISEIKKFEGEFQQQDDITMILLKYD